MMVMLIVILALAAMLLVITGRVGKSTSETIKSATPAGIKVQIQSCRLGGIGFLDSDGDKLADYCDPCPDGHDFRQQSDADFLSDNCDYKPKVTASSAFVACCNSEPKGKNLDELKSSCATGKLIAVDPYFQCDKQA